MEWGVQGPEEFGIHVFTIYWIINRYLRAFQKNQFKWIYGET